MSGRRRGLTDEDKALWAHVVEQVMPLKRRRRKPTKPPAKPEPEAARPEAAAQAEAAAQKPRPVHAPAVTRPPAVPPLAPIDRHERRRLARGTRAIDGRIDLHGMRQAEAHVALRGFLAHSQMRGDTLVLVITGKGRPEPHFSFEDERGVLRRVVPQWLRMPDLRPFVVGFEEAHLGHGGAGALYVRLRRGRRADPR